MSLGSIHYNNLKLLFERVGSLQDLAVDETGLLTTKEGNRDPDRIKQVVKRSLQAAKLQENQDPTHPWLFKLQLQGKTVYVNGAALLEKCGLTQDPDLSDWKPIEKTMLSLHFKQTTLDIDVATALKSLTLYTMFEDLQGLATQQDIPLDSLLNRVDINPAQLKKFFDHLQRGECPDSLTEEDIFIYMMIADALDVPVFLDRLQSKCSIYTLHRLWKKNPLLFESITKSDLTIVKEKCKAFVESLHLAQRPSRAPLNIVFSPGKVVPVKFKNGVARLQEREGELTFDCRPFVLDLINECHIPMQELGFSTPSQLINFLADKSDMLEFADLKEFRLAALNRTFGQQDVKALLERTPHLKYLRLPRYLKGDLLDNLRYTPELNTLEFEDLLSAPPDSLRHLEHVPQLRVLNIIGTETLAPDYLKYLRHVPDLQILNIRFTRLNSLAGLRYVRSLRELKLRACHYLQPRALENLQFTPDLQILELSYCASVIKHLDLLRHVPHLRTLSLSNIGSAVYAHSHMTELGFVQNLLELERLDLDGARINKESLAVLTSLLHLHKLSLKECHMLKDDDLKDFPRLNQLRELDLTNCFNLAPDSLKYLKDLSLDSLCIRGTRLNLAMLESFAKPPMIKDFNPDQFI